MTSPDEIWSSTTLPTLPVVAIRLIDLSKDPEVDFREVVEVIKTDPAIAARILKAVNSSYFGLRSEVRSLDKAIPILGTTVLTSLALSFSLAPDSVKGGELDRHYGDIWLESITHAAAGEVLGGAKCSFGIPCEYFLGGLFADIGRLAMLRAIPDQYRDVLERVQETGTNAAAVETELLGFDHVEIGFKLLREWKLPDTLCEAVKCHEMSVESLQDHDDGPPFDLIKAVKFATGIGRYFHGPDDARGEALNDLQEAWTAFFAGDPNELEPFLVTVREKVDAAGQMLNVDTSRLPDVAELTAEANLQLAELAMRKHAETVEV
ncbi:MAG: HDOD domain-containing protein [Gaiellaceae bacterium]